MSTQSFHDALKLFQSTPERELLLLLSRTQLAPHQIDRVRIILQGEVSWEELIRLARTHHTLPIISQHLRQEFSEALPSVVKEELKKRSSDQALRNLQMTQEMLALIKSLKEQGIETVPFKGPVLAWTLYGDLGYRQFDDLDFLLRPGEWVDATEQMKARGYRYDLEELSPAREAATLALSYHAQLFREEPRLKAELHWRVLPAPLADPFDLDTLLSRSESTVLGGTSLPVLSLEDLLLVLSAHCAKHQCERLIWLVDIAQILLNPEKIHWETLVDRANRMGLRRMLFLCLFLAEELLEVKMPESWSAQIRSGKGVIVLATHVLKVSLPNPNRPRGGLKELIFLLRIRERWQDRVVHILRLISIVPRPTSEEWKRLSLPDRWFFLYYLFRPIRLAGKYGWMGAKLLLETLESSLHLRRKGAHGSVGH